VGGRVCCKDGALNIREAKYKPTKNLITVLLLLEKLPIHFKTRFHSMLPFSKREKSRFWGMTSRKPVNELNGAKKNKLVMKLIVRAIQYEV